MSEVRKLDGGKLTVTDAEGRVREYKVQVGLARLDTARIMDKTKLVKGYLQLSLHCEVELVPNDSPAQSDPPTLIPDDFQEQPHD